MGEKVKILTKLPKSIKIWIILSFIVSTLTLLIFANVQQNYRQNAYDPQIQMAEDISDQLSQNVDPIKLLAPQKIDIQKSLFPAIIVYDDSDKVTYSSATLNNQTPELPDGVLDFTKTHGQDRFTWQPQPGVRLATVIIHYNNGFVLATRNMREVENRTQSLFYRTILAWVFTIAGSFVLNIALNLYP